MRRGHSHRSGGRGQCISFLIGAANCQSLSMHETIEPPYVMSQFSGQKRIMIFELFYLAFVTIFIGLVVLGQILLISAIYKCLRDDWAAGRRSNRKPPPSDWASQVAVKVALEKRALCGTLQ